MLFHDGEKFLTSVIDLSRELIRELKVGDCVFSPLTFDKSLLLKVFEASDYCLWSFCRSLAHPVNTERMLHSEQPLQLVLVGRT